MIGKRGGRVRAKNPVAPSEWEAASSCEPAQVTSSADQGVRRDLSLNDLRIRPLVGVVFAVGGSMITSDKFRARADDCLKEANSAVDPERRLAHLDLAERWLRLAIQIDKNNALRRAAHVAAARTS